MDLLTKVRRFFVSQRLALWTLLASGTYAVLLSPAVFMIHKLSSNVIILIYALPWLLLWPAYSFEVIKDRPHRREIIFMGAILVLGRLT